MAGRFIAAEICLIFLIFTLTPPSGTRQTPTTVPLLLVSPTLHHSRCAPPPHPNPFFACSTTPACDLFALVSALSFSTKLKRFLRDLEIAGPPGEHLPYWDQISYTRSLFDFR